MSNLRASGKGKVVIRVKPLQPHTAEVTSTQLRTLARVAREYGSRIVRTTPRQSIEIPDVDEHLAEEALKELERAGFIAGATEKLRNVFACSKWCLYNAIPVAELAEKINRKYANAEMPAKLTISLSGCNFSCSRSRTSDIGLIARVKPEINPDECVNCGLCVNDPLGCQVDALTVDEYDALAWDGEKCVYCGFCSNVCPTDAIVVADRGFDIYLGGGGGFVPKKAVLFKEFVSEENVLDEVDRIVERYVSLAKPGERIHSLLERGVFDE
jgi:dissimilatory sulfite reductase (desulfoviridin) alpha/beta subunit